MIQEVRLPEISENVESGDVIEVLVKEGDFIEKDQSIVELETEKAAFEVPSPIKGKITEINVKQGDNVKVGQVIVKVDTEAAPGTKQEEPKPQTSSQKEEKQEPEKSEPEKEESEQEEIKEEKQSQKHEEEVSEVPEQKEKSKKESKETDSVPASPSVRQLARDLGIDINKVEGSGPAGRISADDVKEYAKNLISGASSEPMAREIKKLPDFTKWGEIKRESISITRKKISETLSYTWANVPQVTQYDNADITNLDESRKIYSQKTRQDHSKLTVTSIVLKVVGLALKEFPKFNSSYDTQANEIIYKKYFNVSVAVDTDRGLLVPVIRDINNKSIMQLSDELNNLAQKAREHKVTPDDMVGGNFTISNLGGIGGSYFAPIIYWPQVAILGIAHAVQKPCYVNGNIEPRMILPLSLSYDHRIIDGAEGLRFLRWISQRLENPLLFALDE